MPVVNIRDFFIIDIRSGGDLQFTKQIYLCKLAVHVCVCICHMIQESERESERERGERERGERERGERERESFMALICGVNDQAKSV